MRSVPFAIVTVVSMCLGAGSASAGGWGLDTLVERPSAWEGHGPGSMIHTRTTSDMKIPQMPGGGRKTVTETKKTLVRIEPDAFVLKVDTLVAGAWRTTEERQSRKRGLGPEATSKIVDLGEETLTIGGKAYPCAKKSVPDMAPLGGAPGGKKMDVRGKATVWVHPSEGVLKMVSAYSTMGHATTSTMQVSKLDVSRTVGGIALACRELTVTGTGMEGATNKMLMSMDVPGGMVRMDYAMKRGPMEMTTTSELIGYVKKAAVTTPAGR